MCLVCCPRDGKRSWREKGICSNVIIDEPFRVPIVFTENRTTSSCRFFVPYQSPLYLLAKLSKREERIKETFFFLPPVDVVCQKESRYNSSYQWRIFFLNIFCCSLWFSLWKVEGGRLREQEEQSCVLMMSHATRTAHIAKDRGSGLLPITPNHKGENSTPHFCLRKKILL